MSTDTRTSAATGTGTQNGTATQGGTLRRRELAAFLRSRRARITPADVGMPPGRRRRTPGLRREEVAQLAGVGVTWYTWLEQGRPINASSQVLDAIARTLRLDAAEREYLYLLAEVPRAPASSDDDVPEDVRAILTALEPLPAALGNARSDALAWNSVYAAMFPSVVGAPPGERNFLWTAFTLPPCCNPIANMEEQAAEQVAVFRYRYTRQMREPGCNDFVRRLSEASPEFARLWARHDVANPRPCEKHFRYPGVGEIATRTTSMEVTGSTGLRLVVYTPVDERSRERIAWLCDHPEAARPDHAH
ncbi:helix-turn-helix transcriptional regulator [Actinomadura vinacea]|uniref:Helix-turn-helix transcriptional regulator n=1 Tax=Actinomadura vinacea TaxID=115336 RepID=A0ABP5WY20_9ACTN